MAEDWFQEAKRTMHEFFRTASRQEARALLKEAGYEFYRHATEQSFWLPEEGTTHVVQARRASHECVKSPPRNQDLEQQTALSAYPAYPLAA